MELELDVRLELELELPPHAQLEPTPAKSDGRVWSRCKRASHAPASSRNYNSRGDAQVSRNNGNGKGKVCKA